MRKETIDDVNPPFHTSGRSSNRSKDIWTAVSTFNRRELTAKRSRVAAKIKLLLARACSMGELDRSPDAAATERALDPFDVAANGMKTTIFVSWPTSAVAFDKQVTLRS